MRAWLGRMGAELQELNETDTPGENVVVIGGMGAGALAGILLVPEPGANSATTAEASNKESPDWGEVAAYTGTIAGLALTGAAIATALVLKARRH